MKTPLADIIRSLSSGLTTTCDRKTLKELLLQTEGWIIVGGYICDIRTKSLGAGIYNVWVKKRG